MNIVVLSGSPRKGGNTHQLVEAFTQGAAEAGHQARHFDTAIMKINPCRACYYCRREPNIGQCTQQDDMARICEALQEAQVVVLATPLYYFGFAAQLKTAIDRFFSIPKATWKNKRLALLAVCGDDDDTAMSGLVESYRHIHTYLGVDSIGEILVTNVYDKGDIAGHQALAQARQLALSIK